MKHNVDVGDFMGFIQMNFKDTMICDWDPYSDTQPESYSCFYTQQNKLLPGWVRLEEKIIAADFVWKDGEVIKDTFNLFKSESFKEYIEKLRILREELANSEEKRIEFIEKLIEKIGNRHKKLPKTILEECKDNIIAMCKKVWN